MIDQLTRVIILFLLLLNPNLSHSQRESIPCPRNQPVVTYHQKQQAVFMFGGFCSESKTRLNDLWKFSEGKWISITSNNSPEARSGHSMVYDSNKHELILFGGKNNDGQWLNDTWSWDGNNWSMLAEVGPSPRQSHRIVFNSDNGSILLFGGSDPENKSLNDTWLFEQGQWIEKTHQTSPPGRLQHTMAYDSNRKKIVLFGGFGRFEGEKTVYGDTWEWDAALGWKLMDDQPALARDHHAMAYDSNLKQTILTTGYNEGYLNDTWTWNGVKWKRLSIDGPPKRAGKPGLSYNTSDKSIILFGGWGETNKPIMDFWQFKNNRWARIN